MDKEGINSTLTSLVEGVGGSGMTIEEVLL
jgi:hypothetical protein